MEAKEVRGWIGTAVVLGTLLWAGGEFTSGVRSDIQGLRSDLEDRAENVDEDHQKYEAAFARMQGQINRIQFVACDAWDGPMDQCMPADPGEP